MSKILNIHMEMLKGVEEMIMSMVSKAVRHCGEVHNFDAEEMLMRMEVRVLESESKGEKSKGEKLEMKNNSLIYLPLQLAPEQQYTDESLRNLLNLPKKKTTP